MVGPREWWQFQMSNAKLLLERWKLFVLSRHRRNGLSVSYTFESEFVFLLLHRHLRKIKIYI